MRELVIEYRSAHMWREASVLRAVRDVSFDVFAGEALALVGESGCGKSSVARAVLGLVPLNAGSVRLRGPDGPTRSRADAR